MQLPGREGRYREAPATDARSLAHAIVEALGPVLDAAPFALFGHSMGGLLSYEVTRLLERSNEPMPLRLFVSAARAPHLPDRDPPIHALPDHDFLAALQRLKGLAPEVLRHEELLSIVMPVLRADLQLCETYHHHYEIPLSIPITAFAGRKDPKVLVADVDAWRMWTVAGFKLVQLDAEHFYFHTHLSTIIDTIAREIARDLYRATGGSDGRGI